MIRRMGQLGKLKPEKISEYRALHQAPWPEVLDMIKQCNIENYTIFIHEDLVFAYFEYVGENYQKDMAKMEEDETTKEWWKHTKPCFKKYAISSESEFYHDMEEIFNDQG